MKKYLIMGGKLFLTASLLGWLLSSDRLDLSTLGLLVSHKEIFIFNLLVWLSCPLLLGALRWQLLMKGFGITLPLTRVFLYQTVGIFFNTAMPGAVGGDLIKAVYVIKQGEARRKAAVVLTLVLDRFFGIFGLFTVGFLAISWNFSAVKALSTVWPLALASYGIFFGILLGLLWIAAPISRERDPIYRLLQLKLPGFGFLLKTYQALCTLKRHPGVLVKATLYAALGHGITMGYFWYLSEVITVQTLHFEVFSALYSMGMLITTIPIAPGGLGVGHTTFDQLFSLAGIKGGADIFNLFIIGQLCLNCLGFIPFMALKSGKFTNKFTRQPLSSTKFTKLPDKFTRQPLSSTKFTKLPEKLSDTHFLL